MTGESGAADVLGDPRVSVDNSAGAYRATQHLIELGHTRIAHIAGSQALGIARERQLAAESLTAEVLR